MNEQVMTATLQQALAFHQRGQLAQAELLYREILVKHPKHFDALHFLGVLEHQNGRHDAAAKLIRTAIGVAPGQAAAHSNLGLVLQALKRPEEAIASYEQAVRLQPAFAEALLNWGNALLHLSRYAEALDRYDRALAIRPASADAHFNRGNALAELMRHDEALASYDTALALMPDNPLILYNRGNVLRAMKRNEEALASYDRALVVRPDYVEALRNRGNTLRDLNRQEDALASYERVLAIQPDSPSALTACGNALLQLNRPVEALARYDRAIALSPAETDALNNRGKALLDLMRYDEAIANYVRLQQIDPGSATAHYNEALCRLLVGDFEKGWRKYEWRWGDEQFIGARRHFNRPLWLGDRDIAGSTILLHAEQGFGDTLQFCRYAKQVAAMGATVLLEVQSSVASLLSRLEGVSRSFARGASLPAFDYHCPLLSLPLAFNTRLESIPADVPYVQSEPQLVRQWQERLGKRKRPRVGLVWSGTTSHRSDHIKRAVPLRDFAPLRARHAQFVSLQKEVRAADRDVLHEFGIPYFGDDLVSFAHTAALIELMDLVITVDTSVAHLAGAMGKPVWVLLPFNPDWRWLLQRTDSPWYPTARLFRQHAIASWKVELETVALELQQFLTSRA